MKYPARVRKFLPAALRRLPAVLKESDASLDVVNRTMPSPLAFPIALTCENCWAYTSGRHLTLGAVGPAWRGVQKVSSDRDTADLVKDFVHFASQYVIRSRIVRIQAGIALTFGVACDFRYADVKRTTIRLDSLGEELGRAFVTLPSQRSTSRKARELAAWVKMLNPLDPLIHRATFQFWRSCALANGGFWEDSVTALDGVTAIAGEAAKTWDLGRVDSTRQGTGAAFGLDSKDQSQLESLYKLRCAFGAHPAPSKWWDFAELYDSEIDAFQTVTSRLIRRMCLQEAEARRVEAYPSSWSDWFAKNAELLLQVVWFSNLPDLP